jgi:hypothetical protein
VALALGEDRWNCRDVTDSAPRPSPPPVPVPVLAAPPALQQRQQAPRMPEVPRAIAPVMAHRCRPVRQRRLHPSRLIPRKWENQVRLPPQGYLVPLAQRAELELVPVLRGVQVQRKQTQRRNGSVPLGQQPPPHLRPSRRALPRRSVAQTESEEAESEHKQAQ